MKSYTNSYENKFSIYKENKNKSGIYRWNNLSTGQCYIGSSINLTRRLRMYYSKKSMLNKVTTSKSIIYSAILKYGHVNFSLDILEYCESNVLKKREQYYIDLLKPKYNILKVVNSRLANIKKQKLK